MDPSSQLDQPALLLAGVVGGIDGRPARPADPVCRVHRSRRARAPDRRSDDVRGRLRGEAPQSMTSTTCLPGSGRPSPTSARPSPHQGRSTKRSPPPSAKSREAFARFVVLDGLVHGWDLATATDQPDPPTDLVAAVDEFATSPSILCAMARPSPPPSHRPRSSPIERLVAYTGRRP